MRAVKIFSRNWQTMLSMKIWQSRALQKPYWSGKEIFPPAYRLRRELQFPHSEQEYTLKPSLIIALLDKAVSFRPMGGGENVPVETVFLLLLDKTEHQVKMLGNIVSFIQDEANIRRLHCEEAAKSSLASFERFFAPEKAGDIA